MTQRGMGGGQAGRSTPLLILVLAITALLTSQRPGGQLPPDRLEQSPSVGAKSIGLSSLPIGNPTVATEGEQAVEVIGAESTRIPLHSGSIDMLSDRGPLAPSLHDFLLRLRTRLLLADRSPLRIAPKTSPPVSRG